MIINNDNFPKLGFGRQYDEYIYISMLQRWIDEETIICKLSIPEGDSRYNLHQLQHTPFLVNK